MINFDYTILEIDSFLQEAYIGLLKKLDPSLALLNRVWRNRIKSHVFVYGGNRYFTPVHTAVAADFFIQVSNSKRWWFMHKKYFPYAGLKRNPNAAGVFFYSDMRRMENYPAPGIPYTTFDVHPGDMFYFSNFQIHEVDNLEPNLGFAIGMRPKPPESLFDAFS